MSASLPPLLSRSATLKWVCRLAQSSAAPTATSQQGLTLLECLVAVMVITLTITLITPPLFLAAATRQQNRRAEQALQVAQGEVDRIRTIVARNNHFPSNLPEAPTMSSLSNYPAPTALFSSTKVKSVSASCNFNESTDRPSANQGLLIDTDGDCKPEFFIQVYRTAGKPSPDELKRQKGIAANSRPSDFDIAVRVYSILAARQSGATWQVGSGLQTQAASLKMTTGDGNQRTRPLAVIYTPISWSDDSATLCNYHQNASGDSALPEICPSRSSP